MVQENVNCFCDGNRELVFHKSPLVELIASLHSLQVRDVEKNESIWLAEGRMKRLEPNLRHCLEMYGKTYSEWLLIMDLATYVSCRIFEKTGRAEISFEEAVKELRMIDHATYLYFFLGMPALGFSVEDAKEWLKNPESIDRRSLRLVGQYVSQKDIIIFIRNIGSLRADLEWAITQYWNLAFKQVWNDIEVNISKTIRANKFECASQGDIIRYVSNLHNDIYVTKGDIFLKKDISYMASIDDIENVHVFPSTFTSPELLMDKFEHSLVIYYNMNLKLMNDELDAPDILPEAFKALSDSNRLKIIKLLWGSPATTQYLSKILGLAASTVSNHLKILKNAGIISNKTIKKYVYYEVNRESINKVFEEFKEFVK